jgi:hypothetical protein
MIKMSKKYFIYQTNKLKSENKIVKNNLNKINKIK